MQRGLSQIQSSADKWYEQLSGASKPGFVKHTSVRESRTLRKSQLWHKNEMTLRTWLDNNLTRSGALVWYINYTGVREPMCAPGLRTIGDNIGVSSRYKSYDFPSLTSF